MTEMLDGENSFSADRPIRSAADDLLGRARFSKAVARAISSWRKTESLVVGLSGEWGSGKSSIKNMIIEALVAEQPRPYVVQFNPWQWAGQDLLSSAFFAEITIALGKVDQSEKGKERAAKFKLYAERLQTVAHVASGIGAGVPYVAVTTTFFGAGAYALLGSAPLLVKLVSAILIIAAIFAWSGELASGVSRTFLARAESNEQNVEEKKESVRESLSTLARPLLIVIDDIDRLSASEVRHLLQLVKANTDFPNIVFLLLYDRKVVEAFLDSEGFPGTAYLKKIVQVPFDVPQANKSRLNEIFFAQLDSIIADVITPIAFNQTRWGNLFFGALSPYFEDLRSVYRFLSTFRFHAGLFQGSETFEVNPIDLIGIEVLRVFEPEVYSRIKVAKSMLTGSGSWRDDKAERAELDAVIGVAHPDHRVRVTQILIELFPKLESIYRNKHYDGSWLESWTLEARVCVPKKFDRYFLLSLPDDDLSESDIQRLVRSTASYGGFITEIEALKERGLLPAAMSQLDDYKQKIPLENASEFLPALLDIADDLPEGNGATITPSINALRVLSWYLRLEEDILRRGQLLKDAFRKAFGLSLLAGELDSDANREAKDKSDILLDEQAREELRALWLERVRHLANIETGTFMRNDSLGELIFRWNDWGRSGEVQEWAKRVLQIPNMALLFIVALTGRGTTRSVGDAGAQFFWRIDLPIIEKIVPVSVIENSLSQLTVDTLSPKERRAVDAFRTAVQKRERGERNMPFAG